MCYKKKDGFGCHDWSCQNHRQCIEIQRHSPQVHMNRLAGECTATGETLTRQVV